MTKFRLSYSEVVSRFSHVLCEQYIHLDQPKYHLSKLREAVAQSWGYSSYKDVQNHLVTAIDASDWHDLNVNGFDLLYLKFAEQKMGPSPYHIRAYRNTVDHFVQSSCLICSIYQKLPDNDNR
ncbi:MULTISPECIES: hypothetical protein [Corallincola]|uniref:Uncharacterized protein n=3 Tax=Corallincola TaxID=1775176 RepID=A0A368NT47_9GAMM|nr:MULTISPECIES: hypothetical protein [Corallincola]RCU52894.1 hypothetical protein DU002_02725 [Corallincola holothuriorum]TAA47952.1 hypothetical protein EXY25_01525 [Corallincola spongiicola]TCI03390.1 hypothetical protein EZV61_11005 [Corallincola luteus]